MDGKKQQMGTPTSLRYNAGGITSPIVDRVLNQKSLSSWSSQDTSRLSVNTGSLIVLLYLYISGYLRAIQAFISLRISVFLSKSVLPLFVYAVVLLLVSNIIQCIIKYYRKPPDFASVALSPQQRKLLGLSPISDDHSFSSVIGPRPLSTMVRTGSKLDQASPLTRRVAPTTSSTVGLEARSPFTTRSAPTSFYSSAQPSPPSAAPTTPFTPVSATKSITSPLSSFLLRRSPMGLGQDHIRDLKHLDAVLGPKDNALLGSDTPHSPPFSQAATFQPTPPQLGKFQPASRTIKGPAQPAQVRKENGLYMYDPSLVLQELNIEDYIEEWTEKMRKWMSAKVLNPLVKRIDKTDSVFREANLSHLDTKTKAVSLVGDFEGGVWRANGAVLALTFEIRTNVSSLTAYEGGFFQPASSTFGASTSVFGRPTTTAPTTSGFGLSLGAPAAQVNPSSRPSTLEDLFAGYSRDATVQERMKLEKYLIVPGHPANRLYILERIRTLSKGGVVGAYQWTGGADWEGKPWDKHKDLPSDLLLLLHLFATFMDETITPWDEYGRGEAFSRRHVTLFEAPSLDPMTSIQIRLADPNPPNLQLIVNYDTQSGVEKRIWQTFPKRNNLFHALSIFVYYVKVTAGGFLGVADLRSKSIDLIYVVEPQPSYSPFLSGPLHQAASITRSASGTSPQRGSIMGETSMTPGATYAGLTPASANPGSTGLGGMVGAGTGSGGIASSTRTPLPNPFVAPRSGGIKSGASDSRDAGYAGPSSSSSVGGGTSSGFTSGTSSKRSEVNTTPFGTPTPVPNGFNMSSPTPKSGKS
ncbi:hypothetical protein SeLEV6574_g00399 [Synchytrium endobioticum]|uniref:Transmembrane protein n=1 Tax=Synchytrium endobioticum TaxID=286115 RepID=A0A507DI90_9FUNG|nr:hypothetical protein SeLEV6574_g00399 [Synchytrium endobioticum]